MKHSLLGLLVLMGLSTAIDTDAVQVDPTGKYIWKFHSGQAWPNGYQQSTGKPNNLIWAKAEYSSEFFTRINNALPESKVNSVFLTDDIGSNITLKEDGDVYVTFIHEGAGYLNSFGFFTFDKNSPPSNKFNVRETIIFPNLSYPHLASGHRVHLGNFKAGTSIGFFLAANGFSTTTGVKNTASPFYYSIKNLNPEPTDILRQHNVLLRDPSTSEVIMGFEDLSRQTGDNDFNDAVFSVKVTPSTALETNNLTLIPAIQDADSDGISDSLDEFPNDFLAASSSWYPSQQTWSTLAFEDDWPKMGDYDMNDLVVRQRLQIISNSKGQVTRLKILGNIDARGAANHNGFGLRLMNQSHVLATSAQINIGGSVKTLTTETKQSNPVFLLWNDSHTYTTTGGSGSCSHFNTVKVCPTFPSVPYEVTVNFQTPISQLNQSQLDFFIFRQDFRGREIHLADYPPTDRFDMTQFGKYDDRSNASLNRYFRNANNFPWAIKISDSWRYPQEYIDVVWAFPGFENWVESSGANSIDWYKDLSKPSHYF